MLRAATSISIQQKQQNQSLLGSEGRETIEMRREGDVNTELMMRQKKNGMFTRMSEYCDCIYIPCISYLSSLFQATSRRRAASPVPQTVNSANGPTGPVAASPAAAGSKFAPSGSGRNVITAVVPVPSWTRITR